MEEGPVRSEVEDGQALLTIDRPAARNPLSPAVVDGLRAALSRAEADPSVRVVVLTGAGDRVFSAGGDLSTSLRAESSPVTRSAGSTGRCSRRWPRPHCPPWPG